MAVKLSTAARNAVFEPGLKSSLGTHVLRIFSGEEPATADATRINATLLCTISTGGAAGAALRFSAPENGRMVKSKDDVWSGVIAAGGTPTFYRLEPIGDTGNASTTTVRIQGTVGVTGDLRLDGQPLVVGEVQPVNYYELDMPTSAVG